MIKSKLQAIAELFSLGMTIPTVVLAFAVVYTWLPSARAAWSREQKTGQDWFILGVAIGFCGAILDNLYWFIPWTASYIEHHATSQLINTGVFFNIVFRQGLGIAAAYCHLKAAELTEGSNIKLVNSLLVASNLVGFSYALTLVIKHGI